VLANSGGSLIGNSITPPPDRLSPWVRIAPEPLIVTRIQATFQPRSA
jgi:hypothetical protein